MGNPTENERPTLRSRFESFVETLDGFESIDALLRNGEDPPNKKRADYLFQSRSIIVEQKALETNPANRPQKFADKIIRDRGIIAFGTLSTRRIFSGQPDANSLQRRLVLSIAGNIDDNVAKADKQARDTRLIFDIPTQLASSCC
jgi:hypothetical protein